MFFWIRLSLNAEVSIILLSAMSLSFKEELLLFTFIWENCLRVLDNQHCLALPSFLFILEWLSRSVGLNCFQDWTTFLPGSPKPIGKTDL